MLEKPTTVVLTKIIFMFAKSTIGLPCLGTLLNTLTNALHAKKSNTNENQYELTIKSHQLLKNHLKSYNLTHFSMTDKNS
uniref:Putative secreted protein n=1 Tax=Panstrongylus lignarius TaxID=156445 RepID=A0A224Y566_9HEMI